MGSLPISLCAPGTLECSTTPSGVGTATPSSLVCAAATFQNVQNAAGSCPAGKAWVKDCNLRAAAGCVGYFSSSVAVKAWAHLRRSTVVQALGLKELLGGALLANPALFSPAACHESCSSCWGAAESHCLSCRDPSHVLQAGLCLASCAQGFFPKDGVCTGKYL